MLAPVGAAEVLAAIDGRAVEHTDPVTPLPQSGEDVRWPLLARIGHVDPTSLDDYRAQGGYAALRRAFELGGEGVIRELKDSRLMGRGGAAFPTGVKWEAVAHQAGAPALPDLQRRRVRARDVQGPRRDRGRSRTR